MNQLGTLGIILFLIACILAALDFEYPMVVLIFILLAGAFCAPKVLVEIIKYVFCL